MTTPVQRTSRRLLILSFPLIIWLAALSAHAATYTVNHPGDSHDVVSGDQLCLDSFGACTLRAALQQAGGFPGDDTIIFDLPVASTIELTKGTLNIATGLGSISIVGPGEANLTVQPATSSGFFAVFTVTQNGSVEVNISNLSIAKGRRGGIAINSIATVNLDRVTVRDNENNPFGGGILNANGELNLTRCTVRNNTATGGGGGVSTSAPTVLRITDSTINDNRAPQGGGIRSGGPTTVINSTITRNVSPASPGGFVATGGGILSFSSLSLTNATVSHNSADFGGGIQTVNEATIRNTLIAENTAGFGPDVSADSETPVTSLGNNLIGNGSQAAGFIPGLNEDLVGTAASPINAMLGPLQNNGGPTSTRNLLPGSPAIDAASSVEFPERDQRNFPRPIDSNGDGIALSDVGAVERNESITLAGRVTGPTGLALRNVTVTLVDSRGNRRSVTTSSFGSFTFLDVIPGESYFMTVASKRYRFTPRSLQSTSSLVNVDFAALE